LAALLEREQRLESCHPKSIHTQMLNGELIDMQDGIILTSDYILNEQNPPPEKVTLGVWKVGADGEFEGWRYTLMGFGVDLVG
jgi:hypothetical protein